MKYFIDEEFIENGPQEPIQFISIGIVSEEGDEYYAVSNEFDESSASEWVKENVIKKLDIDPENRKPNAVIAKEVIKFIGNDPKPIFVTNYGSYDWVVFCQLFGTMMDLPENFPMWTYDLQQLKYDLRVNKVPEQEEGEHNALADARYNKKLHDYLMQIRYQGKRPFNLKDFKKLLKGELDERD